MSERDDLLTKARAGDGEAFAALTEPHRRELRVHCYRLLGSLHDAEDALQDTMLSAWQAFDAFEERASLRTWLYRIATNRCSNARRAAGRRRAKEWNIASVTPPEPTRLGEVSWLEPFPDALFEGVELTGPDARYERRESMSLAFVTALQRLPPRQLAVLVLRDVLGFHADEVATMLDASLDSANSALKRARASLEAHRHDHAIAARSPHEEAILARFVTAYEAADVDAIVALLTDDVLITMPPFANEYVGRDIGARFVGAIFSAGRRFELVTTRANGQPAIGAYLRATSGAHPGAGVFVLSVTGDRIAAMTRFEPSVLAAFGLPPALTRTAR